MAKVLEITPKQYLELAELGVPVYATWKYEQAIGCLLAGGDNDYGSEELEEFATWGQQRRSGRDWKYFTLVDSD